MLTTYTKAQLMAQWRLRRGLEPMRGDVTVELDGVDSEALDEAEMMDWWHHTLVTAPAGMLERKEMSARCVVKVTPGGGAEVELPINAGALRVTEVRLNGWKRDGRLVAPDSREAELQRWEYTQAGMENPVVVVMSANRLMCFPAGDEVEILRVITEGDGEVYTMDSGLLATMGTWKGAQ